jgi:RHS repeat-associated protein
LNRVQTVTDVTLQKVLGYTYDPNGNRATFTVTDSTGMSPPLTTSYQFDSQNRLSQITDPDGDATQLVYDAAGNRKGLTFGNGVAASYGYDSAERLTSITYVAPGGSVLEGFAYQLDPAGNRRLKIFADGTFEQYAYDTDNRLTQANYPSGLEVDYTLDGVGNRQVVTERVNGSQTFTDIYSQPTAFNQISEVLHAVANGPQTTTDFSYDNNGNLVSQAATPRGGTTATTTYTFDLDNRLRQVNLPTGLIDTYEYDANGLRTRKVDSSGDTRFLLDGPSIVADYDAASGTRAGLYVQNPQRIDEIFAATISLSGTPTKVYPLTDALGSSYELTDSSGNDVSNFSYDAYGARTQTSGSVSLRFGFTGREQEPDSGLNYNRDRYLSTGKGSWTQPDRPGVRAVGPNLYGYVNERPLLFSDSMGFFAAAVVYANEWQAQDGRIVWGGSPSFEFSLGLSLIQKGFVPDTATPNDMSFAAVNGSWDLLFATAFFWGSVDEFVFVGHGTAGSLWLNDRDDSFDGLFLAGVVMQLDRSKLRRIIIIACGSADPVYTGADSPPGSPVAQTVANATGVTTTGVTGLYFWQIVPSLPTFQFTEITFTAAQPANQCQ